MGQDRDHDQADPIGGIEDALDRLSSSHPVAVRESVKWLGEHGRNRAEARLLGLLRDPGCRCGDEVARALRKLGRRADAVMILRDLIETENRNQQSLPLRDRLPSLHPGDGSQGEETDARLRSLLEQVGVLGGSEAVETLMWFARHGLGPIEIAAQELDGIVGLEHLERLIEIFRARPCQALGNLLTQFDDARVFDAVAGQLERSAGWGANLLSQFGERALPALLKGLESGSPPQRRSCAQALERMGWQPGSEAQKARYLVALTRWEDLAALGNAVVEPLLDLLADTEREYLWPPALKALANCPDARIVEPVQQLIGAELRTREPGRRGANIIELAVSALQGVASDAAASAICRAFSALLPAASDSVAQALHRIDSEEAALAWVDVLDDNDSVHWGTDGSKRPRASQELTAAAEARIRAIASGAARHAVVRELRSRLSSDCPLRRYRAAWALRLAGWKPGSATDCSAYAIAAMDLEAIVAAGPDVVAPLLKRMSDGPAGLVRRGLHVLARLKDSRSADKLAAAAVDRSLAGERRVCALALLEMRATEHAGAVSVAIRDGVLEPSVESLGFIAANPGGQALDGKIVRRVTDALHRGGIALNRETVSCLAQLRRPEISEAVGSLLARNERSVHPRDVLEAEALRCLGESASPSVAEIALQILESGEQVPEMRAVAVEVAVRAADPETAARFVVATAWADYRSIEAEMIAYLGKYPSVETAQVLCRFLGCPERRAAAATQLNGFGSIAIPPLIAAHSQLDRSGQKAALTLLQAICQTADVHTLFEVVREHRDAGDAVAATLSGLGPSVIPELIQRLADRDEAISETARAALILFDGIAIPQVVRLLEKGNSDCHDKAVGMLGAIGDSRGIPPLRSLLENRKGVDCSGIWDALLRCGWTPDSDSDQKLCSVIPDYWIEDHHPGGAALPALMRQLMTRYQSAKSALYNLGRADDIEQLRQLTSSLLAEGGHPAALRPLIEFGLQAEAERMLKAVIHLLGNDDLEKLAAQEDGGHYQAEEWRTMGDNDQYPAQKYVPHRWKKLRAIASRELKRRSLPSWVQRYVFRR